MTYPELNLLNDMMRNDGLTLALCTSVERGLIKELADAGYATVNRRRLLKRATVTPRGVNAILAALC